MSYWDDGHKECDFGTLVGLTLKEVDVTNETITFLTTNNRKFVMDHSQSCCESVEVESVVGDWNDLIGRPILLAEQSTSDKTPEGFTHEYEPESQTWTFYKLATIKGYVDIRWFGSSNGYYSESVDFCEVSA